MPVGKPTRFSSFGRGDMIKNILSIIDLFCFFKLFCQMSVAVENIFLVNSILIFK